MLYRKPVDPAPVLACFQRCMTEGNHSVAARSSKNFDDPLEAVSTELI